MSNLANHIKRYFIIQGARIFLIAILFFFFSMLAQIIWDELLRISLSVLLFFGFHITDGKVYRFILRKIPLHKMDTVDIMKYYVMDSVLIGAIVIIICWLVYKINLWMVVIIIGAFLFREYRKWRK